jgi:hypothetical protein
MAAPLEIVALRRFLRALLLTGSVKTASVLVSVARRGCRRVPEAPAPTTSVKG